MDKDSREVIDKLADIKPIFTKSKREELVHEYQEALELCDDVFLGREKNQVEETLILNDIISRVKEEKRIQMISSMANFNNNTIGQNIGSPPVHYNNVFSPLKPIQMI